MQLVQIGKPSALTEVEVNGWFLTQRAQRAQGRKRLKEETERAGRVETVAMAEASAAGKTKRREHRDTEGTEKGPVFVGLRLSEIEESCVAIVNSYRSG
jgi:uncharacterized protein YdaU (DUF1376 family)